MRDCPRVETLILGVLGAGLLAGSAAGATVTTSATAGKPGMPWEERLAEPVHKVWARRPLGQALNELAHVQGVALWLDRRVDPGRPLDLDAGGRPLREVLDQITQNQRLGLSLFAPVVYLGPPEAAARLRTVAQLRREEIRRLPVAAAGPFYRAEPSHWDDLAEPRALIKELGRRAGVAIRGLERVPHDLWPAADWPPMAMSDRLTLLLFPLDLTFRVDPSGRAVELAPLPDKVHLVRSYPGGSDPASRVQAWTALAPRSRIRVEGNRLVVSGTWEDHERLRPPGQRPRPNTTQTAPPSGSRLDQTRIEKFTVRNQPLRRVLEHVARQMGLELDMDEAALRSAGISLDRLVSLEIEGPTLDELLEALLKPVGLRFVRQNARVQVIPATK